MYIGDRLHSPWLAEVLRTSAASIVLVHNHPSGNPYRFSGDDETTRDLDQGARLSGFVFIENVIISEGGYYSYADAGRLCVFRGL